MFKRGCIFLLLFVPLLACNNSKVNNAESSQLEVEVDANIGMSIELSDNAEEDVIFYNLLYPIDLGVVIDKRGSYFNSKLLNPLNNISNYQDSRQIALALGVYGANLSYLWVFDQSQQALSYFTAIKQLAYDLGIPDNYVKISAVRAEKYSDNIDSLVSIARESYHGCDDYLRSSDNGDLAVLILLGGWVETLHISLNLYQQPNDRMALKILSQKYSLASLITLLNQHPSNDYLVKFNKDLFLLLNAFDDLQNKHLSDQLIIDTLKKKITFQTNGSLIIESDEFNELRRLIDDLRDELVN